MQCWKYPKLDLLNHWREEDVFQRQSVSGSFEHRSWWQGFSTFSVQSQVLKLNSFRQHIDLIGRTRDSFVNWFGADILFISFARLGPLGQFTTTKTNPSVSTHDLANNIQATIVIWIINCPLIDRSVACLALAAYLPAACSQTVLLRQLCS